LIDQFKLVELEHEVEEVDEVDSSLPASRPHSRGLERQRHVNLLNAAVLYHVLHVQFFELLRRQLHLIIALAERVEHLAQLAHQTVHVH